MEDEDSRQSSASSEAEDRRELEALLYSQVHHDSAGLAPDPPTPAARLNTPDWTESDRPSPGLADPVCPAGQSPPGPARLSPECPAPVGPEAPVCQSLRDSSPVAGPSTGASATSRRPDPVLNASVTEVDSSEDEGILVLATPTLCSRSVEVVDLATSEEDESRSTSRRKRKGSSSPSSSSSSWDGPDQVNVTKIPAKRAKDTTSDEVIEVDDTGSDQSCREAEIVIQGVLTQTRARPPRPWTPVPVGTPLNVSACLTISMSTSENSLTEDEGAPVAASRQRSKKSNPLIRQHREQLVQAYKAAYGSSSDSEDDRLSLASAEVNLNLYGGSFKSGRGAHHPLSAFKHCPREDLPIPVLKWTEAMSRYYNEVDMAVFERDKYAIMDMIPDDSDWTVSRVDRQALSGRFASPGRRSRYFDRSRCNNCSQVGHMARNCPDPAKATICRMCGTRGHYKDTCPQAACLRCAQPISAYSTSCFDCQRLNKINCHRCGAAGHVLARCPDVWRRFHQTVEAGPVHRPPNHAHVHKSEAEMSCSNCAKVGHSVHNCRAYRPTFNPFPVIKVVSYEDPRSGSVATPEHPQSPNLTWRQLKKQDKALAKAAKRALQSFEDAQPTKTHATPSSSKALKRKKLAQITDDLAQGLLSPSRAAGNGPDQSLLQSFLSNDIQESKRRQTNIKKMKLNILDNKGKIPKHDLWKFLKRVGPVEELIPKSPWEMLSLIKQEKTLTEQMTKIPKYLLTSIRGHFNALTKAIDGRHESVNNQIRKGLAHTVGSLQLLQESLKKM